MGECGSGGCSLNSLGSFQDILPTDPEFQVPFDDNGSPMAVPVNGIYKPASLDALASYIIKLALGDTPAERMALAASAAIGLKKNQRNSLAEPGLAKKTPLKPSETGFDDIPIIESRPVVPSKRMTQPVGLGNMNSTNTMMRYMQEIR